MRPATALTRKNLMVDEKAVRALRRVLGAASESEAVRTVVRDRLLPAEARQALDRIRARRGLDDVFGRRPRRSPARRRTAAR